MTADQLDSAPTLTPITLSPPRPMVGVVNGVSYLQEVRIGDRTLIVLLDHLTRIKSVHGQRGAGITERDAFRILAAARGVADNTMTATCTILLAGYGYRLETAVAE